MIRIPLFLYYPDGSVKAYGTVPASLAPKRAVRCVTPSASACGGRTAGRMLALSAPMRLP
jgi:hypothetical protein